MVMISLLKLPLSLPPDAPARQAGLESFVDGLPEYFSRCQSSYRYDDALLTEVQARPTKGESQELHKLRLMGPTLSVRWRA